MMMNAMTKPYSAMASTNANPIHIYFVTRASASGLARHHFDHFPEDVTDPHTRPQENPAAAHPIPINPAAAESIMSYSSLWLNLQALMRVLLMTM